MARVGFGVPDDRGETAAVFARVPAEAAEKLDRAAFALRRPKQEIVAALLATLDEPPVIGRAAVVPRVEERPEVLTLEEAADLLRADVDVVRALAEQGTLPGQSVGDTWRFSRTAILDWLARR
jgi:excisionase family DNA binding protein